MKTIRLTAAQALVRYAAAQLNEDGVPFLAGAWAIFGHGNVAGLGEALYAHRDVLPTLPGYLKVDLEALQATLLRRPKRSEVPVTADVQLVVEHYSR